MIPMTLDEIAAVVDGTVHADRTVTVSGPAYVDSREPARSGLFVAVVGEHVDGHDYAEGAHAVLGSRPTTAPTVVVPDPVAALGDLARHLVDRVAPTVLALTGSQGKTGTKDYLAHVLSGIGSTVATRGNHNNELGVPLTVLEADAGTRFLVVEMGARGVGHISRLCRVAPPTVAAVLNVGTAHLSEFGSREQIARAKGEIVADLPESGVAVLNADDPLVAAMAGRTSARVLSFGLAGDLSWADVVLDDLGRPSCRFRYAGRSHPVTLTQSGAHQVANAAAAAAMAIAAGVDPAVACERLTTAVPASRWRMELHERPDGLVVINDAYNANPASMAAAVDALAAIAAHRSGRAVAVLGEMLELGEETRSGHLEVGRRVAEAGIDLLVTVGEAAGRIAEGARSVPHWQGTTVETVGRDDALTAVRDNVAADDVVLVKASRGAALEHVAEGLLEGGGSR